MNMNGSTSSSSSSSLRRSPRSLKSSSPYFSSQASISSGTSSLNLSRDVSSISSSSALSTDASASSTPATKGSSTPKTTAKKAVSPSPPGKKAKRKANKSPTKTKKKGSKKSKTKSSTTEPVAVPRTRSFEPAWWGNVLTRNTESLHDHVAVAASAKQSSPTPKPTKAVKDDTEAIYPPVHTLILGTHPSIASLDRNEMYGHSLNAFWYIAGDSLGFRRQSAISPSTNKPYIYYHDYLRHSHEESIPYSQQLERLVSKGFAIWDIIAECEREGSLDTDIEAEVANPVREFCEGKLLMNNNDEVDERQKKHLFLNVKRIVIANGTTGAKFFVKHYSQWFVDGKLCAAGDEMSQRVFKSAMNKAKKANGAASLEEDIRSGKLIEVVCLPGVSPAAAKFTYLQKRDAWERGCYGPGLADFHTWEQSRQRQIMKTPEPVKTSKSPRKSPSPSPSKKMPPVRILSSDLASLSPGNAWIDLEVPAQELRPSSTLTTGQCFNWLVVETKLPDTVGSSADASNASPQKQSAWGTHDAKEWVGPLHNRVISIRETPTTTQFRVLHGPADGVKEELHRYFRLETPLAPLYKEWSKSDARMAKITSAIPGVRILRQDPVECMFSFICSSNNNIPRITKMLSAFRETYGAFMIEIPTHQQNGDDDIRGAMSIYSFPSLASLARATEEELRDMGLGYRAKYIIETRDLLVQCGGNEFLLNLRNQQDSQIVQDELIKFSGIGRKVADCVALFSLDSDAAIPVDVHVQHIASRDYDPSVLGEAKSITPTIYKRVGDLFRDRFEIYPGWAHSLLFVAELPSFRGVLPVDVVREMDEWREHEQRKKQEKKEESKRQKQSA